MVWSNFGAIPVTSVCRVRLLGVRHWFSATRGAWSRAPTLSYPTRLVYNDSRTALVRTAKHALSKLGSPGGRKPATKHQERRSLKTKSTVHIIFNFLNLFTRRNLVEHCVIGCPMTHEA